jgi:hypothetical protein
MAFGAEHRPGQEPTTHRDCGYQQGIQTKRCGNMTVKQLVRCAQRPTARTKQPGRLIEKAMRVKSIRARLEQKENRRCAEKNEQTADDA